MYRVVKIKTVSKFSVWQGYIDHSDQWHFRNHSNPKQLHQLDIGAFFWDTVFSRQFLDSFLKDKYIRNLLGDNVHNNSISIQQEIDFLLSKIEAAKRNVNFLVTDKIPGWNDIFFSFRLFSTILWYINHFYKDSDLNVWLASGIDFHRPDQSLPDLLDNIAYYKDSQFIQEIILPIISSKLIKEKKVIYKIEIFWPGELVLAGVISSIIKDINPDATIVLDFSWWNEQFDFTQWVEVIVDSKDGFFKYFDYFIVDRDFGIGIQCIQQLLQWKITKKDVKNVIFYDKKIYYNKIKDDDFSEDMFNKFVETTFTEKNIFSSFGIRSVFVRFLPYKCYWSNCSFCAINSQNKFSYDTKYSYDYFVNLWIEYIEKYKIESIVFLDEAIPPTAIINFAKKVVQRNIKINYQFRTRSEKLYTYNNCKILADSWCWFCGMWLESAVDSVNEIIWWKGNRWVTIRDKLKIVHNFDKAGVSVHNYSIMWFPGETDPQIAATYNYLKTNIIRSYFYTCTPNIFYLMKWPKIFSEREKYGIEVNQEEIDNPFNLAYSFTHNWKQRNFPLLNTFVEDLHKTQFIPWLTWKDFISGTRFWEYIDRSYLFYILKRYHKKNPFYTYKNINNAIIKKEWDGILDSYFDLSPYLQFISTSEKINDIYDWVSCERLTLTLPNTTFLEKYDSNKNLRTNIEILWIEDTSSFRKVFHDLLRTRILMYNQTRDNVS